jgi:hypothetical protein
VRLGWVRSYLRRLGGRPSIDADLRSVLWHRVDVRIDRAQYGEALRACDVRGIHLHAFNSDPPRATDAVSEWEVTWVVRASTCAIAERRVERALLRAGITIYAIRAVAR